MADEHNTTNEAEARRTIARLATETLPRLIDRLARSELGELEVRDDGWRIRLRRAGTQPSEPPARAGSAPAAGHAGRHDAARGSQATRRTEPHRDVVTSPAVGYFMPTAGLSVGTRIRSGD